MSKTMKDKPQFKKERTRPRSVKSGRQKINLTKTYMIYPEDDNVRR